MSMVLVTGGSGFIGGHCILQCLAAGHQVRDDRPQSGARTRSAGAPQKGGARRRRPAHVRCRRSRARRRLAGGGRRLRLRAARRLAVSAERAEARGRTHRSRPRRGAEGAEGRARRGRQSGRADLLLRRGRLRPQGAVGAVRRGELDRSRAEAASAPTSSRRRSPSERPGISSRQGGRARTRRSSIRSACSARCSGPTSRPRSRSSSA